MEPGIDQWGHDSLRKLIQTAERLEGTARLLRDSVAKCLERNSIEGLQDMVAISFNAQQYTPAYGGGGNNLPPGKYKGVIVDSSTDTAKSGGGFLMFTLTPIEGPLAGQKHDDRLNLHNTNPKTVEIANKQLSAYCHVLGRFQFQNTEELHNIPFCFEIGWQKGNEPSEANPSGGYTEVKAIFDVNGNAPGKAGSGPAPQAAPAQPPAAPPAGVAPNAPAPGAWGGQPAPQAQPDPNAGQWGGQPPAATQPAPQAAPGTWGGAAAPAPGAAPAAPAAGPWGAPQAAPGAPPQWGAPQA